LGGNIPFRVIFRNARIARPKPGFWGQKARNAWRAARIASASPLHHPRIASAFECASFCRCDMTLAMQVIERKAGYGWLIGDN